MEIRDYFSGFAVVASLVSLLVSLRTARFNSRVKAVELKTDLLLKASAIIRRGEDALIDYGHCKKLASRPELEKILIGLSSEETLKGVVSRVRKFRDESRASVGVASVHDYEKHFAVIADADERMEDIRAEMSAMKTNIIAVLASIDAKRKKA